MRQADPDHIDQPQPDGDRLVTGRRVTVHEAADILGITVEAVRGRLKRGTLQREKALDGTTLVMLDGAAYDQPRQAEDHHRQAADRPSDRPRPDDARDAIIERQQDEIEFLRRELERKDAILLRMAEGLGELPAPVEPRESPTSSEESGKGRTFPEQDKRSWWHRLLGR